MNWRFDLWKTELMNEEKTENTVKKYIQDMAAFADYLGDRELTKLECINWKTELLKDHKEVSINSMLAALNKYLAWAGKADFAVKPYKIQPSMYRDKSKELSVSEYRRIAKAAYEKDGARNQYIIDIIASTGIRVSELRFVTVKSLRDGIINIYNKGKSRKLRIPAMLLKKLRAFIKRERIKSGPVFVNKKGKALHRSTIWSIIKKLTDRAGVAREKLFPHNFRHFYAVENYKVYHDLDLLATLLGHSRIETTRIYIRKTEDCLTNDRIYSRIRQKEAT